MIRPHRPLAALTAAGVVAVLALAATPGSAATTGSAATPAGSTADAFAPQLVTVTTPDRAAKSRLMTLGLDVTEHAGHDYVEVVLHTAADEGRLRAAGFAWDVRIDDLVARELERIALDQRFAAANLRTALPSGRTGYRDLADFGDEIDDLAAAHPTLAKRISIGESVEGRELTGIEIGRDVQAPEDGRPVFLMFGAHHAREWPSAELPMEFAHDLVQAYTTSSHPEHARVQRLLDAGRIVIVPVSNPDGYDASRTSGDIVDFREIDNGGTITILGTPGNAYKRKNCRFVDGQTQPAGLCAAPPSPGGFALGVDLNRNYGALWGGPGATDNPVDPTYHGPAPFSEPETQAIRDLISSRQVTTLISNHTFSNLILRPVGVNPNTELPDGSPAGFSPDECFTDASGQDNGMQALGERMAAQNGYSNQFGWELYDTTGTTEDYSYNATGGYGYTFELGPNEFHPPFEQVVGEYTGANAAAEAVTPENASDLTTEAAADCGDEHDHESVGGGNRAAFLEAFENAIDTGTHSVITGKAPAGARIEVERSGVFPLWDGGTVADTVATAMTVGPDGAFEYHVNPSTRPFVQSRRANILGDPREQLSVAGSTPPLQSTDYDYVLEEDADVLKATVRTTVGAGADTLKAFDLVLLDAAGNEVAAARNFAAENTLSWTGPEGAGVPAGDYVLRVEAGVPVAPSYTVEAAAFDVVSDETPGGQVERWNLTCTVGESRTPAREVLVERGQTVDVGRVCSAAAVAPGTPGAAGPPATGGAPTANAPGEDARPAAATRGRSLPATGGLPLAAVAALALLTGAAVHRLRRS